MRQHLMQLTQNPIALPIMVMFLTVAAHLSYIHDGLVWLDAQDILKQHAIVKQLSLESIKTILTSPYSRTEYFRPMFTLYHSILFDVFGTNYPAYHAVSISFHTSIVLLIPHVISLFTQMNRGLRWISALIFGIHPFTWFTVGVLTSNQELLMTFGILTSLIAYAHARRTSRTRWLLITLLTTFFALSSKETAVYLLPTLLITYEYISKHPKNIFSRKIQTSLMLVFVSYAMLRTLALERLWQTTHIPASLTEHVIVRISVVSKTITGFLLPVQIPLTDATPMAISNILDFVLPLIAILAVVSVMYQITQTRPVLLLLAAFTLLPTLNVIPLPRFWSPNYGYSALIFFIPAVLYTYQCITNQAVRYAMSALCFSWIIIGTYSTYSLGTRMQNDLTLFEPEIAHALPFPEAHYYLGNAYLAKNNNALAKYHYEEALRDTTPYITFSDPIAISINYAGVLFKEEKLPQAYFVLRGIYDIVQGHDRQTVAYNLAVIAYKQGNTTAVIQYLEPYTWDTKEPLLLLGAAYADSGDHEHARNIFTQVLPLLSGEERTSLQHSIEELL